MEMTELERRELEQSLRRDLEQLVRDEARSPSPLVPRKFEVGFGSERSAPELQRGLDLGDGVTLSREDRPDRPRSRQRARDRPGLQVGPYGPLRSRDREGAPAPDPALHARPARPRRDRAARRPLPAVGRRAPTRAACSAPRRRTTCCPGSSRTTTSRKTRSGRRSRVRAIWRAASHSGSGRATCGTTRRGRTAVRPGATSGACAGSGGHENCERTAGCGDRGARAGLRLRGRGDRQDDRARRALRRGGVRARPRRRVDARDHLHGARRGRAARQDSLAPARARAPRSRPLARRSLDLDDPRLLPAPAEGAPVRRRARPAVPGAGRQPGPRDPRRGVRDGAERVLRRRRSCAAAAPRDLRRLRACAGC